MMNLRVRVGVGCKTVGETVGEGEGGTVEVKVLVGGMGCVSVAAAGNKNMEVGFGRLVAALEGTVGFGGGFLPACAAQADDAKIASRIMLPIRASFLRAASASRNVAKNWSILRWIGFAW
jgi:hypothetical protein